MAVEGKAVEYTAPFILPWVALAEDPGEQHPESFVPFCTGPEGAVPPWLGALAQHVMSQPPAALGDLHMSIQALCRVHALECAFPAPAGRA